MQNPQMPPFEKRIEKRADEFGRAVGRFIAKLVVPFLPLSTQINFAKRYYVPDGTESLAVTIILADPAPFRIENYQNRFPDAWWRPTVPDK